MLMLLKSSGLMACTDAEASNVTGYNEAALPRPLGNADVNIWWMYPGLEKPKICRSKWSLMVARTIGIWPSLAS